MTKWVFGIELTLKFVCIRLFFVIFSHFRSLYLYIWIFYCNFAPTFFSIWQIIIMIQEFSVKNFYSIRERQSISFVPSNDDSMRMQYTTKVADEMELLKIGIVYGSNASGKTTILNAISYFRKIMLEKPSSKNEVLLQFSGSSSI